MKTRFDRAARPPARQSAAPRGARHEAAASPRTTARDVAQRERIDSAFGAAAQRVAEEDELQMKRDDVAQRQLEEEEPLQGRFDTAQRLEDEEEPLQAQADAGPAMSGNVTAAGPGGLPARLRSGIEALSGMDMSDVQVHTASSKPAEINALAYTQGDEIHVASGQEQHLAHEAWHVVQQRQGRVQPTMQIGDVNVNDDAGLEAEADRMGEKARQTATGGSR